MKKIELLAPAKNAEIGITAINFGADAVYIGATGFGARSAANNEIDEIEKLIKHAHLFNAKVYATINTIIYDHELEEVEKLINELYKINVDAIIIQDMSILEMDLPPIPIFASTQADNRTVEKVNFFEEIGIKRVILARELSIPEITKIKQATNIELEAFVHGSICVSYSGQCNMSQATCDRSGNRGDCAQNCRLEYDLLDRNQKAIIKNKHLLSLKDMNLSGHIPELLEAGITSFKIEGRLKDEGYVKNVVAYYRKKIDEAISRTSSKKSSSGEMIFDFEPDLQKSFNRGFTRYFIEGRKNKTGSIDTPKSIGKKVGEVVKCNPTFVEIKSLEQITNGDGLCYFDENNVLQGFSVNKVMGDKIFTNTPQEILPKTYLYRNFDIVFNRQLENSRTTRKIAVHFELIESETGFIIKLIDQDKIESKTSFDTVKEPAQNTEKNKASITQALSKLGNTPFIMKDVIFFWSTDFFIPTSQLSEIKRNLIEKHIQKRINSYKNIEVTRESNSINYPISPSDYSFNISNKKAREFYEKHSVEVKEMAYEIENTADAILMTTKHCIKYENDLCPKYNISKEGKKINPEFIKDKYGNIFELGFDCKRCVMTIKMKYKCEKH
ncbi:MAG: U32 family peptidase [Bacteroidota bacterium]